MYRDIIYFPNDPNLKIENIILKYIFYMENVNVRREIWLEFLTEYDFEIVHIKAKEKKLLVP